MLHCYRWYLYLWYDVVHLGTFQIFAGKARVEASMNTSVDLCKTLPSKDSLVQVHHKPEYGKKISQLRIFIIMTTLLLCLLLWLPTIAVPGYICKIHNLSSKSNPLRKSALRHTPYYGPCLTSPTSQAPPNWKVCKLRGWWRIIVSILHGWQQYHSTAI